MFAVLDGVMFRKADKSLFCYPQGLFVESDEATVERYAVPAGIRSIGSYAFFGCDGLAEIVLPDGLTDIGDSAFFSCDGLTAIDLPETLERIGNKAFASCSALSEIGFPEGLKSIGYSAFSDCAGFTALYVPASVEEIGHDAFFGCPNLFLTVERETFAAAYARDNNIEFTYSDINAWLNG